MKLKRQGDAREFEIELLAQTTETSKTSRTMRVRALRVRFA